MDPSFVIERTENFKVVGDHGFRCKRKSGFFLPRSVFWIQMGKMARVICGMMNFPGLRFVPSKKKKKLDPFANVKRSRLLPKLIPFLCF